jgi:hypothetical protein
VDKHERGERERQRREEKEHEGREHKKEEHEHPEGEGRGFGLEQVSYRHILARRWKGSTPPTPQSYARAIKQWRQLPGAVVTTPADLGTLPPSKPPEHHRHPHAPGGHHEKRES